MDYTTFGQANIIILEYIDEILYTFDKADLLSGFNNSSAVPDITFKVNKYYKNLNAKQSMEFHHLVAKILFATKKDRPNTCTIVSFLTTLVIEPDNYNWSRVVHLMKYVRSTRNIPLILGAKGIGII